MDIGDWDDLKFGLNPNTTQSVKEHRGEIPGP